MMRTMTRRVHHDFVARVAPWVSEPRAAGIQEKTTVEHRDSRLAWISKIQSTRPSC